eukprot:CAMPEP_0202968032 /NCGR_PEP_ID=MMETSP1396-20130829/13139_1 /ASSEMBLY_ACC=CAM_ASM_000872 /TAXON_ID= /ORGANISM="Pseudokeronopsis sp., Strain Brazil" /LENGTH=57 /DNA_ID=CAMNT_0049693829 /DNA_START=416 /DNA_END=589 /DNA_ORIENTATION=+
MKGLAFEDKNLEEQFAAENHEEGEDEVEDMVAMMQKIKSLRENAANLTDEERRNQAA